MTSECSPPDATQPESRREDGTKGATSDNDAASPGMTATAATGSSARSDSETSSPDDAQSSEDDGATARRDESKSDSDAESRDTTEAHDGPRAQDAAEQSATEGAKLEQVPSSGTVAIEVNPDQPKPPPPPSQRPKIARRSTAEPLGVTATLPPPGWPPRVVADLMTRKIITMREDEPIGDLESSMDRFQFHHVPVVTADMKLVGLITRTDLLHARLGVRPDGTAITPIDASARADTIMRRNVVVGRLDYSLTTACRLMVDNSLPCLPVVLEGGYLLGILTQSDLTRLALAVLEQQSRQ